MGGSTWRARLCGQQTRNRPEQANLSIEMGKNQSKLSKEDKDLLHRETGMDKTDIEEWYEGFKRDCPSGELDKAKFVAMYSKMFPRGNAETFAENIFRTVDFREFMLALHVTSKGSPEEKLSLAFRMYDVDGNGTIERTEMKRVVGAVYDMLGTQEDKRGKAEELFSKMDQNADGTVSQDQFVAVCKQDQDLLDILTKG